MKRSSSEALDDLRRFLFDFIDGGVEFRKFFLYFLGSIDLKVKDLFSEKG